MNIIDYTTASGKSLIDEYLDKLPKREQLEAVEIRLKIEEEGHLALRALNTRKLRGKLWEIKFSQNRIMYVVQQDDDTIYFLHACKKQKDKAEKFELEKAIKRAKEFGLKVD